MGLPILGETVLADKNLIVGCRIADDAQFGAVFYGTVLPADEKHEIVDLRGTGVAPINSPSV